MRTYLRHGPSNRLMTRSSWGSRELIYAIVGVVTIAAPALAQHGSAGQPPRARPELHAYRVTTPPTIDGALDDEAWSRPPVETGEWLSYNPLNGDRIPQDTHVWI